MAPRIEVTQDAVNVRRITAEEDIAEAEELVRREYARAGIAYRAHREPVMLAAYVREQIVGLLCARPGEKQVIPAFQKYMPAFDCMFILPLGKVVVAHECRGGSCVLRSLFRAMHNWASAAGYTAFWFETTATLARKYVHVFGFAQIGTLAANPYVEEQAALLFSSFNNPRLVRWLFTEETGAQQFIYH